tara:strand:+ start:93 stop:539 length:447 start_codon:yes stop_codon:yes gene_type:complete
MQQRVASKKNKFPIAILLAIFFHEKDSQSKVGVLRDIEGKLRLPEKPLSLNKNSYEIAKELLEYYVTIDRLSPFDIRLCASLDGPNKYPGDYLQNVSLIFKLDITDKSLIEKDESIDWITPAEAAEAIENKLFAKDHAQAIEMAIYYG